MFDRPGSEEHARLSERWSRVRDGDSIDVQVLIMDLGGSSGLATRLNATLAHEVKERFRE